MAEKQPGLTRNTDIETSKHIRKPVQTACLIRVKGLVQGVGFRPFVFQMSKKANVRGWVRNTSWGVEIKAEGTSGQLNLFLQLLKEKHPIGANFSSVEVLSDKPPEDFKNFSILTSQHADKQTTVVSPDIAVCEDCLQDIKAQRHRVNYPFTNCTNCGPRFSIIREMPYDRQKTTMQHFDMCPVCETEYQDLNNRRFHAQPVACNHCGPVYRLYSRIFESPSVEEIPIAVAQLIEDGKTIAMKGLGGYNLVCNALYPKAVNKIRDVKNREGKPFAVMFRNVKAIETFAYVNHYEKELLESWSRPIVLLTSKNNLPGDVSNGLSTVGAMLPYLPLHYLIFEKIKTDALIFTSANVSDEPIIIDDAIARKAFFPLTDAILENNREIYNRTDDSVCQVAGNQVQVLRRSRGYAPLPVEVNTNVEGIFAAGAELTNCFCLGKDLHAILSQHIGDLKNYATYEFFTEAIERYKKLFNFHPELVVHDLHPDYLSTVYAVKQGLPTIGVQHHHAHVAAVMAEHHLDDEVIGIALDGTGYGTDGNIWGGEVLQCSLSDFVRVSHLEYVPMPGGEMAVKQPWRMAAAYLYQTFGESWTQLDIPFLATLKKQIPTANQFIEMLAHSDLFPLSSGAGRLFDAVAALTGCCWQADFHAEAPMRLESAMGGVRTSELYPFHAAETISFKPAIEAIVKDLKSNTDVSVISAKFHNTVVEAFLHVAHVHSNKTGIRKLVLSGGVFQNSYITEKFMKLAAISGFTCYTGNTVPINDGGLALGQLVIAAAKRQNQKRTEKET